MYKAVGSRLVAVMRRSLDKAEDFARRHKVDRFYSSVEDLLQDPQVNAVYIASPVGVHVEHALAAAKAGKPTLLEKPIARCEEEAMTIVKAFEAAKVPLWVAYYRRAHPTWVKLRSMLEQEELGEIRWVEYSLDCEISDDVADFVASNGAAPLPWRLDPQMSGGGLAMDVGVHAMDLLSYLLGNVEVTSTRVSQSAAYKFTPVEDYVLCNLSCTGYQSEAIPGIARWDFAQPKGRGKREMLRIVGTNKIVEAKPLASDGLRIFSHRMLHLHNPMAVTALLPPITPTS
uniref:Gfo/Idh/MocA-like oxidoreductase N-terminal domain-containing protein n=1 Tax=Rhizochromulina marina TaxID=1034831 RepID=A0A7S2R8M0_9STRA|mmetsp:Transcript_12668/g.36685  ORF Transcript_12668/g.36685 Transcript_12668/m.36685 type:complete len:287 (+) Transcript_12668:229-1089(+)